MSNYCILTGHGKTAGLASERLEELVNIKISEGFIPVGGVCVVEHDNFIMSCSQAMIKDSDSLLRVSE